MHRIILSEESVEAIYMAQLVESRLDRSSRSHIMRLPRVNARASITEPALRAGPNDRALTGNLLFY
jgi:hypothetical protein